MGNFSYTAQPLLAARRQPVSLGRYALHHPLGAGASSTVWAGYDPESGREVAVTLMRTLQGRDEAREALADRARAWQGIEHPNVAKVSDAGMFLDPRDPTKRRAGVFMVRELVSGVALQRWLDALPADTPNADRILEVFCAAGRGLAAIHAAGLVHRDTCAASVIVGYDGVARLVDFAGPDAVPMEPSEDDEVPRYPAPEIRAGATPDARADQYSFCALLWATLQQQTSVRIGRRLREVLARGMAERPEDRWPSMAALIKAIERTRSGWFRAVSASLRR